MAEWWSRGTLTSCSTERAGTLQACLLQAVQRIAGSCVEIQLNWNLLSPCLASDGIRCWYLWDKPHVRAACIPARHFGALVCCTAAKSFAVLSAAHSSDSSCASHHDVHSVDGLPLAIASARALLVSPTSNGAAESPIL